MIANAPGGQQVHASRWRAAASPGGLIGVLATLLACLLAGGAILVLTDRVDLPVHDALVLVGLVIALVAAAGLIYLLYGYVTISYEFSDKDLTIRWAGRRDRIQLESIQQIIPAIDRLEERPGRWPRFWPGYYVGIHPDASGPVNVVATLPLRRQLLIRTQDKQFAISPERPVLFVEEYGRLRRALDLERSGGFPTVRPGESAERLAQAGWTMPFPISQPADYALPRSTTVPGPARRGTRGSGRRARSDADVSLPERSISPVLRPVLLNDAAALGLLAVAVILNVLMVTYILVQYESLPQSIVMHWNVNGDPDRIGSPREIWVLPIITALVTVANFGLAWSIVTFDRFAARFLLASTCLVQLVAWIALLTLIR